MQSEHLIKITRFIFAFEVSSILSKVTWIVIHTRFTNEINHLIDNGYVSKLRIVIGVKYYQFNTFCLTHQMPMNLTMMYVVEYCLLILSVVDLINYRSNHIYDMRLLRSVCIRITMTFRRKWPYAWKDTSRKDIVKWKSSIVKWWTYMIEEHTVSMSTIITFILFLRSI